jgi:hypothetical protein
MATRHNAVIPAKVGIHTTRAAPQCMPIGQRGFGMDSRLRGNDGLKDGG